MPIRRSYAVVCVTVAAWCWKNYILTGPVYSEVKDLRGKTVLITGGNAGIGKAAAIEFAKMGARVVIASRNVAKSEVARNQIVKESKLNNTAFYELDLERFESVRDFAQKFLQNERNLDILVNNAGVTGIRGKTPEGINRVLAINHFGPFLLTNLLLDKLKDQSKKRPVRIINVSSFAHKFVSTLDFQKFTQESDGIVDDYQIYGSSKLANNLFTFELHRRLADYDITTYAINPGSVRTDLGSYLSLKQRMLRWTTFVLRRSAFYGAQTILYCALDDDVTRYSGDYFAGCEREELAEYSKDEEIAEKLWRESEKIAGLE